MILCLTFLPSCGYNELKPIERGMFMNSITVLLTQSKGTINPNIYGHFSEHIGGVFYDGLWVGEDSKIPNIHGFRRALVESFAKIHPPVLRWQIPEQLQIKTDR